MKNTFKEPEMKIESCSSEFRYNCCHCDAEVDLPFPDGDVFEGDAYQAIEEKGFSIYADNLFYKCGICKEDSLFVRLFFMQKEGVFFENNNPTKLTNKYLFENERLDEGEEPKSFLIEGLFPLAEKKTTVFQYETQQGPLLQVWLGFFSPNEIYWGEADKIACNAVYTLKNGFPLSGFKEGQAIEDWDKFSEGFLPWFVSLKKKYIEDHLKIQPSSNDDVPF